MEQLHPMTRNVQFQTVLDALLDAGTPFPARFLHHFSDISPADLAILMKDWPNISTSRKHTLLEDLEELAEADTLTNFDDLSRPLLTDGDPQVRIRAIHLLWENEDTKLVQVFLGLMNADADAGVRAAAANALGLFVYQGELEKIPAKLHHRIEDDLLMTATSANQVLVRRRALESLGYSGRQEVIPLIDAAYHDKNPDWVVSALFAMGRSGDERWKKQVLSKLHSPDEDIRSEAIHAAGELELASARPILFDLLADEEDLELRRELIWALSKIDGEGVRDRLEELLDAETDDAEADFIEQAMDNLTFTEDLARFDLIDLDSDVEFHEEESDEQDGLDTD
jgi:HEAT repeat protein